MRHSFHPDDEALVGAMDGELAAETARAVEGHLAECRSCRERVEELRSASASYARSLPPVREAGPAVARLRSRIAGTGRRGRVWTAGVAAACAAVFAAMFAGRPAPPHLPDARLTPGSVSVLTREQICAAPADDQAPPIAPELARRVFDQYRIRKPRPGAYEVDYLITPALGGTRDIANLWPQPYEAGEWNARVKDALEDRLRQEVCAGRTDLATAQREIATDWVAAYRRHFRTGRPLAEHAMFVKDRPWAGAGQ